MNLYKGKYRTDSVRLKTWDYSKDGYYFITICTHNREQMFGEIENGIMILNEIGLIVKKEWYESFKIRKELFCDSFVIMPNHIHGIIVIDNPNLKTPPVETHGVCLDDMDLSDISKNTNNQSDTAGDQIKDTGLDQIRDTRRDQIKDTRRVSLPGKSVSSFVSGFKSSVTSKSRKISNKYKIWQPKFYDHIIRNEDEYYKIKNYIETNPLKWNKDIYK